MKSTKIYAFGIAGLLLTAVLVVSCTKSFDSRVVAQYENENSSNVQLFLATVGASRNYVYVDAKPVNGAALASGSLFPATGYGFSVPTGIRAFLVKDTLTASTQTQLSFAQNMEIGKHYTIFVYDTITAVKQKTVETSIVVPGDTTCRLRFANFIYNPNQIPAVDIFSFNRNTNIFTNVSVTDVTGFIPYPSILATDTFYIRPTGTTTNLLKLSVTGGLTPKRSYTIVYRGSDRGTRTVSLIADR
ncbi:MAG: DUF4397 domain-containing protein [Chitinophagaceae bacterium]|nr:DUF4397 domain-containing protein [Chitinophagaceae bacterium]